MNMIEKFRFILFIFIFKSVNLFCLKSLKHKWAQEMKGIEQNAILECEAKETFIQETKK